MVQRPTERGWSRIDRSRIRRFAVVVLKLCAMVALLIGPAQAQATSAPEIPAWSQSYINPFPKSGRYSLYVFGDVLAADLARALPEALDDPATVEIERETRNSSGLARPDRYDWSKRIENIVEDKTIHIAVIMVGANDHRRIRAADGYKSFGTEAWAETYRARVDAIIKTLTKAKVAVYWMGLPIAADEETQVAYETINDIIRERAYLGGVKYVDTWNGFADQFGNYSAFGPGVSGVTTRLRDNNGIGFTEDGGRKLAGFAASVIKRDLAAARRERTIPLAGDEEQQRRLTRLSRSSSDQSDNAPSETARRQSDAPPDAGEQPGPFETETVEQDDPDDTGARADSADSVRVTRPVVSFSDYAPPGEQLAVDMGDELTALATISPANILSARGSRQRLPLAERLYYRVLVQGEKLEAPKGRVDNYQWDGG